MGPVVVETLLDVFANGDEFGLPVREEFRERGRAQHDAVVKIRHPSNFGDPFRFIGEPTKFLCELTFTFKFLS